MATRTDRINTTRGLLREFGLDLPQGPAAVLARVPTWLADEESPIPPALRAALTELIAEIRALDTRIAAIEQQLRAQAKLRPEAQRLMAVPGIGLLIATALIAAVGGMEAFRNGRHPPRVQQRPAPSLGWHQQARRPLPADAAHPRCPRSSPGGDPPGPGREGTSDPTPALGGRSRRPGRPQQGRLRAGEQTGPHRVRRGPPRVRF